MSTATLSVSPHTLPEATRAFVESASTKLPGNSAQGEDEAETKDIKEVIFKISEKRDDLKFWSTELTSKTYLVGSHPSAADLALFFTIQPALAKLSAQEQYAYPPLIRYVDHVQSLPSVQSAEGAPTPLSFDLENAPQITRVAEAPKKAAKKKAEGEEQAVAAEASAKGGKAAKKDDAPADKTEQPAASGKKAKKEKGGAAAAPAAAAAADSGEPQPSMIDLRVGKIIKVERHPDADGLYVEQIDIGEETGPRTVVSGLVNYMPIEALQDRTIIVVANLKPANMRGVKSFAMVLCASAKEGKEGGIEFVEPPEGSAPGERVFFEGEKYKDAVPQPQLNPKKKVFETIQPGFTTLQNRDAAWVDPVSGSIHRIVTKDGPCKPKTLVGASLS